MQKDDEATIEIIAIHETLTTTFNQIEICKLAEFVSFNNATTTKATSATTETKTDKDGHHDGETGCAIFFNKHSRTE
jgi:hypothetical protein